MMVMMMVDWIRFIMMVYYWFDVLVVVVNWIRVVMMVVVGMCRMVVLVVDGFRLVVMVAHSVVVKAWWVQVLHMLVHSVVRHHASFIQISTNIPTFVRMVGLTNMAVVEMWGTMVNINVVNWPMVLVEVSLCMVVVVLMVQEDVLGSVVLMVDNGDTMWFTVRGAVGIA